MNGRLEENYRVIQGGALTVVNLELDLRSLEWSLVFSCFIDSWNGPGEFFLVSTMYIIWIFGDFFKANCYKNNAG